VAEIMPAAVVVQPDEGAYGLREVELLSPFVEGVGQKMHRYQIIHVNRGDRIAEYREDLGLASDFDAIQFNIPSYWEHTVGELRDIAQDLRARPANALQEFIPQQGEEHKREFWKRYTDLHEAMRRKGRSY
jgi:hypothetical protein